MLITTIAQPTRQLGADITELLDSGFIFQEITFVSAFVGLRAVLRLKERFQLQAENFANVNFTVGIDLGGTSREVLEQLVQWRARTSIVHNPIPRITFHPKLYFFRSENFAVLFIGSNNWTDGGLYTNYELATRYDFSLPQDADHLNNILGPLQQFLYPNGPTTQPLTPQLIEVLSQRGTIVSEAEARRRRNQTVFAPINIGNAPPNPFMPVTHPLPPLLPTTLRANEQVISPIPVQQPIANGYQQNGVRPIGALVWQKALSASEALQINREGTNPVGGIRLTQARFEDLNGRIDQTEYFRNLFSYYHWGRELGRNRNSTQELAIIPMRIFILGRDYGVHEFEVSHKPDGEANQGNYTTIIRWGRYFSQLIPSLNLEGHYLSLYETADPDVRFFIEVS
ncbi:hypothetical protein HNO91_14105 [Pseudomonas corrugata]|uniref:Phospholipase D-like domain-containing protein n=1 Tax=Pseudomonas corrugata TaxID=47879 RepID=A0A7Y5Z6A6_9PSED|nr:phospholipase D family protein [Pseudomonas corrugata]NUT87564.1 hypothetical protein [Pseudomonas corrugata]